MSRKPLYYYWAKTFRALRLEKFKMRVVHLLIRLRPKRYCWADCVSFAFSPTRWNIFKIDGAKSCEIESIEHEHTACYCGGWQGGVCFGALPRKEQKKIREDIKKMHEKVADDLPF